MEQPPPQQASRGELGKAPRHTCHDLICQGDLINSLSTLPNEILLQVFSYVDVHRSARVLGYIPDDPPPSPQMGTSSPIFALVVARCSALR